MDSELPGGDLGAVVARASGLLLSDEVAEAVLSLLTSTAVRIFPASYGAGISTTAPDGARITAAATDAVVQRVDDLQYELDEGPCLTAWRTRQIIRVDDVATDTRWPVWGPAAAELGVGSTLSAPAAVGETAVGALKLYAPAPGTFGERHETTLAMFAAQVAILVSNAQHFRRAGDLSADVQALLAQRDLVTLATGVVMGRDNVSQQAAFAHLVSLAQHDGGGVHQVAARIVAANRSRW
ncbi:GAF and ANTAR domain-containing protein [Puerhibacterium puerhi]|uniref:GAF and ANTAR domain-containing protein n=1 Tax=Puerhibacterium puerhi TaxID=2692623 RepID=UPI00135B4126|nr:GAF and ANTAR domain-containing protein [Puerhibacterium puerhi]